MKIEFDPDKNDWNIKHRGLSFTQVEAFDFDGAMVMRDERKAYPEVRYIALGMLQSRLHVLCFTPIEAGIRVISLRKANAREVKSYEQTFG